MKTESAETQARKLIRTIDAARVSRDIKSIDMGDLTGTSTSSWYHARNGIHMPNLRQTILFANAVGLRLVLVPMEEETR